MEWLKEILGELVFACLGVVITAVATWLGTLAGKLWKEKAQSEEVQSIAKTCVRAVEQMYRDLDGEEKLGIAMEMCKDFAAGKGIKLSADEIRIFLESALAGLKGAFRDEVTVE